MEKSELVALLSLSSWCLVIVVWLFLAVPWFCLQLVIVVLPDHTHLLFFLSTINTKTTEEFRVSSFSQKHSQKIFLQLTK